ncbi:MAG TPA: hypothetical protein VEC99_06375, partial [Clostridia bacterium]|nr:hypothetical protein [Clostridia bacterium]
VQALIRRYFQGLGTELTSPKGVFFNEREGSLWVRATLPDLDVVEYAVQVLNQNPPQVNIKAKFYAVPEELASYVWNLVSQTNQAEGKISGFTTLLAPSQMPTFLRALETAGVESLSEASVTTLSGRQTQVQIVDFQTVATNINPRALSPPGVSTNADGEISLYLSTSIPVGPTLDIIPYVLADGVKLQLTNTASLTEFLGYDALTNYVPVYIEGRQTSVALPLPRFKVRQISSAAVVWDGQTLVLGSAHDPNIPGITIPGVKDKRLLALLTPIIINPAGYPIHQESQSPSK